jgi:hypothetical protein
VNAKFHRSSKSLTCGEPAVESRGELSAHQNLAGPIGREAELAALRSRLAMEGSVLAAPGMPGLGKTTLALEFAHRHGDDFEAVYWLPCVGGNLASIARELAFQLGLKLEGDLDRVVRDLKEHCAGAALLNGVVSTN